jgi:hypothetical protein
MKVVIKLTPEQMEQLAPLFDEAERKPLKGAVLGQAWDAEEAAAFEWVTPAQLKAKIRKAVNKANDRTINPAA